MNEARFQSAVADLPHPRSIARRNEGPPLTSLQSAERGLIHSTAVATPAVDAFRALRTSLVATMPGAFVTLVAPVTHGSGGSFVARNLSAAFALDETKSALLVDCDLRHPSQHATLRIDPSRGGLVDYLEQDEIEIEDVLYETGVTRMHLIPTGKAREAGTEYLSSLRMRLMLDALRCNQPTRYVFLDGPPVLAGPDARILSDSADVVVLVAGHDHDTPAAIARAAASFDPAKFAGVIYNHGV
ncbi:MAG: CpsD/CapB family tyrosine-protein kinase [Thermomonas sp.]